MPLRQLRTSPRRPSLMIERFTGVATSTRMKTLLRQAERVAQVPRAVLIRGERGTGKELLARFIHDASQRADQPFVAINCAAFSETLMDAELFGHEKGGFTGASDTRPGRLEQADGGTLFLDEIGNMPAAVQERILRVLEYQSFERVRGHRTVKVDVRLVSATNAELESLMAEGLFRADLYDRLTFAELSLPPLRQRVEELPHLVVHFVRNLHQEMPNLPPRTFDRATVEAMMEYHWPGNIRELKNVVERVFVFGNADRITPDELPPEVAGMRTTGSSFHEQVEAFKRQLIEKALSEANGNQRAAAEGLAMTYDQFRHFYRKFRA